MTVLLKCHDSISLEVMEGNANTTKQNDRYT